LLQDEDIALKVFFVLRPTAQHHHRPLSQVLDGSGSSRRRPFSEDLSLTAPSLPSDPLIAVAIVEVNRDLQATVTIGQSLQGRRRARRTQ
jgi:hypothetical protein